MRFRNTFSNYTRTTLFLALTLISSKGYTDSRLPIEPKLGLWEITVHLSQQQLDLITMLPEIAEQIIPGDKAIDLKTGTIRHQGCLTSLSSNDFFPNDPKNPSQCKPPRFNKINSHTMSMNLQCQGALLSVINGTYSFTSGRDFFNSKQILNIAGFLQEFSATGKHLSECPKKK